MIKTHTALLDALHKHLAPVKTHDERMEVQEILDRVNGYHAGLFQIVRHHPGEAGSIAADALYGYGNTK